MTRRAIGSYDVNATPDEKIYALRIAIDEAVGELICEHRIDADEVSEHCQAAVEAAVDDLALEDKPA
jgi:hypothetical protein